VDTQKTQLFYVYVVDNSVKRYTVEASSADAAGYLVEKSTDPDDEFGESDFLDGSEWYVDYVCEADE